MLNFVLCFVLLTITLFPSFTISNSAPAPSWQANYKDPLYFAQKNLNSDGQDKSIPSQTPLTDPEDERISGYLFELNNLNPEFSLERVMDSLSQYVKEKRISVKTIIKTPTNSIFFLKKVPSEHSLFFKEFSLITSWLFFNRRDSQVSIRPIALDQTKASFAPAQALFMDAPQVKIGDNSTNFIDPEKAIVDGYHIHLDYLVGQKKQAEILHNLFAKKAQQKKIIFSELDWYPPNSNGPHKRAGWEVKFEKMGSKHMENYGYSLIWLMLNHGEIPIYSHSKSWIFGENEKRLISHLDNALYSGAKPDLNQHFFYNPENSSSGLYRWDAQLPSNKTISPKQSLARQKAVLEFWFGKNYENLIYPLAQSKLWFNKQKTPITQLDQQIKTNFSQDLFLMVNGFYDSWLETPRGKLAAIILLDQFPRNIFRGKPMAFAYDQLARSISENAIEKGDDKHLTLAERLFLYLPFEHSENIEDQKKATSLILRLKEEAPKECKDAFVEHHKMALHHQLTIEKFQYFPSRNKNFGRESSAAELAFMKELDAEF